MLPGLPRLRNAKIPLLSRENFDFDSQIASNFCKKSILVNYLDVRLPPFPRVPSREFPASKNTPAGEIAGEFREASPCPGKGGTGCQPCPSAAFPHSRRNHTPRSWRQDGEARIRRWSPHPPTATVRLQPRRPRLLFRRSGVFKQRDTHKRAKLRQRAQIRRHRRRRRRPLPALRHDDGSGTPRPARPFSKPPATASRPWPAPPSPTANARLQERRLPRLGPPLGRYHQTYS
jgi:hypothetical protein